MRIAILHDYFDKKGGGERLVINLAKALKADIYTGFIEREKTFDTKGINITELGVNKNQSLFKRNLEISKKFKKLKLNYDFYIFSGVYCISASLKPNLLYLHTPLRAMYDLNSYFMKQSNLKGKLMLKLASMYWKPKDQKYMKNFDKICPNSENVKNRVLRFYGPELHNKCEVVYTGIETKEFKNKKSKGFYLSASRLDKLKRIDLLIEAFKQLNKKLIITGSGPDENRLKELAKDCKNIQFVGSVNEKEMKRLYSECFATVCANMDEDLGLTPIESNASGKPSICVKEGGFKETVVENVNGLFFEPNIDSLLKAIKKSEKIKWNIKKIQKSAEKYDINAFVKRMKYIIEDSVLEHSFNSVRDTPFKIPLFVGDNDSCCSGKHDKLYNILKNKGYKIRYRVCVFLWPEKFNIVQHDKDCTHTYLEVFRNGKWRILDCTWDNKLSNIFHINNFNDEQIAVKPIKIFSPEKSLRIVKNQTKEVLEKDLERNKEFYNYYNKWLEKNRN